MSRRQVKRRIEHVRERVESQDNNQTSHPEHDIIPVAEPTASNSPDPENVQRLTTHLLPWQSNSLPKIWS